MLQISGNVFSMKLSNPNFDHRLFKVAKQRVSYLVPLESNDSRIYR